jgi:LysM repeat protein
MRRFLILPLAFACSTEAAFEANQIDPQPTTELASIESEPIEIKVVPALTMVAEADPILEPIHEPIHEEEPLPTTGIQVRHGESLAHLAHWSGVTIETLADLNSIDLTHTLYPGQSLLLPTVHRDEVDLQRARETHRDTQLDRYLTQNGGLLGVTTHQVHTGETAWSIVRDADVVGRIRMPLWVLSAFNRDSDLDRLRVGQTLYLPVLGDSVEELVEAESSESVSLNTELAVNETSNVPPLEGPTQR